MIVSTHDLTKRSTALHALSICDNGVSTHDLTKRSTGFLRRPAVDRLFQLTTSRRGRLGQAFKQLFQIRFNSRPHEEVDGTASYRDKHGRVSTHDLTKRSTIVCGR